MPPLKHKHKLKTTVTKCDVSPLRMEGSRELNRKARKYQTRKLYAGFWVGLYLGCEQASCEGGKNLVSEGWIWSVCTGIWWGQWLKWKDHMNLKIVIFQTLLKTVKVAVVIVMSVDLSSSTSFFHIFIAKFCVVAMVYRELANH